MASLMMTPSAACTTGAVDLDAPNSFLAGRRPSREGAFGVLHDVALVDNRDRLLFLLDGVLDRAANEPFCAGLRYGLDADADRAGLFRAEADLLEILRVLFLQGTR